MKIQRASTQREAPQGKGVEKQTGGARRGGSTDKIEPVPGKDPLKRYANWD